MGKRTISQRNKILQLTILGRATLAGNGWAQRSAKEVRKILLETLRGTEGRELDTVHLRIRGYIMYWSGATSLMSDPPALESPFCYSVATWH